MPNALGEPRPFWGQETKGRPAYSHRGGYGFHQSHVSLSNVELAQPGRSAGALNWRDRLGTSAWEQQSNEDVTAQASFTFSMTVQFYPAYSLDALCNSSFESGTSSPTTVHKDLCNKPG